MKLLFKNNRFIITALLLFATINIGYAINPNKYVTNQATKGSFPLASKGKVTSILVSDDDFPGVLRVVGHLQKDLQAVTSFSPAIIKNNTVTEDYLVIIGTLGK